MKKLTLMRNSCCAILLALIIFYNPYNAGAQRLTTVKGLWGLYYRSIADIETQQQNTLAFYGFAPGDTIASVGAQSCNWEAAYAAVADSLFFYLQDIDTTYCNNKQAKLAWQYYSGLKGTPLTSRYAIVIGDEASTHLPPASCNKILITNSFHEFTKPAEMLHDIAGRLKRDGILYIDESLARYSGELHPVCKKRIFLESELIDMLQQNGFVLKNSLVLMYHKKKPSREIFAFAKAGAN